MRRALRSLVSADEVAQLQKIEKLSQPLLREEVEGFEPEHRLPTKESNRRGSAQKSQGKPGAKNSATGRARNTRVVHRQNAMAKQRTVVAATETCSRQTLNPATQVSLVIQRGWPPDRGYEPSVL